MKEKSKINDQNHTLSKNGLRNIDDSEKYNKFNSIINFKINHILRFNLIVHNSTVEEYNIKVINDIIYNENKKIVSKFKDHLIYNDPAEFLRRYKFLNEILK